MTIKAKCDRCGRSVGRKRKKYRTYQYQIENPLGSVEKLIDLCVMCVRGLDSLIDKEIARYIDEDTIYFWEEV